MLAQKSYCEHVDDFERTQGRPQFRGHPRCDERVQGGPTTEDKQKRKRRRFTPEYYKAVLGLRP